MVKNFYAVVNNKNQFLKESITDDWDNERIEGQFYNVISESLYNYLKDKSKNSNEEWISIGEDYKPENIEIPFVNVEVVPEKLQEKEEFLKKLKEEGSIEDLGLDYYRNKFKEWTLITKDNYPEDIILEEDSKDLDITGIYMSDLNGHYDIEGLTNFNEVDDFELIDKYKFFPMNGVSDNASQVKNYLNKIINIYLNGTSKDVYFFEGQGLFNLIKNEPNYKFILLLTPIINNHDTSLWGGWRWHKWGEYIGKHNPQYEYLDHETGIDYVLVWKLCPVERSKNNI
jgi:hypothetical protein